MTESKKWNPSLHAVKRLKERLGIEESNAKNFVNQLMQTATYVTTSKDGSDTYHHAKRNVFIVVNTLSKIIITVYPPMDDAKSGLTIDRIANAVKREFQRMQREINREVRKLTEQAAVMRAEAAQLTVNKIRCKNPVTQTQIQTRIDDILTQADALSQVIDDKIAQMKQAKAEVEAVVSEQ